MKKEYILKEIDNIKNQLVEKYKLEKIILFGYAVREGEGINDIDRLITKRDVPLYGTDRIIELYRLMDTSVAVDYVVYTPEEVSECLSLGDPFIKKILREGKVLYG